MELVSLKRDPSEKKDNDCCIAGDESLYPWGTRIHLNQEELDKIDVEGCKVGDEVMITCKAKVASRSEHETEKETDKHVEFQITDMAVDKGQPSRADKLYD